MRAFDPAPVLDQLKDFQRRTAEHVFARLYTDQHPVDRFLVADEVGLGKTFISRGVIAQAVAHLLDEVERVDVLYVCSNGQIAQQNLRRLQLPGVPTQAMAERLTMLPITAHQLDQNRVNMVAFTPGTSFDVKGGSGMARERMLLRLLLDMIWDDVPFRNKASLRVFQGTVQSLANFSGRCDAFARSHRATIDPSILQSFSAEIDRADAAAAQEGRPPLKERYLAVEERCEYGRHLTREVRIRRHSLIADLRHALARACLDTLEPDLIVLDEFQRFKHLMAEEGSAQDNPSAELARELFSYRDEHADTPAKVLLLSATPYKMLTTAADTEDDHHTDLVDTIRFLLADRPHLADDLAADLRLLRQGLLQAGADGGRASIAPKDRIERTLRRAMVRTERLAASTDTSGMLRTRACTPMELTAEDVARYVADAQLARRLDVSDPMEFWKSAPYLLSFMDGYAVRRELDDHLEAGLDHVGDVVEAASTIDLAAVAAFREIDPANARLRWLHQDTIDRGAWKLLWIPPSLPYLTPTGPYADPQLIDFTKRLLFSSWAMVPNAVSTLLSHGAERRMVTSRSGRPTYRNTPEDRSRRARLLDFSRSKRRLTGMPVLGMLYPSVVLSRIGDPLRLCREAAGGTVSHTDALASVAQQLDPLLEKVRLDMVDDGYEDPQLRADVDERWYWAAPLWLDWLADPDFGILLQAPGQLTKSFVQGDREPGRFREHLDLASTVMLAYPDDMGRMPDDLAEVLARVALAGPGVCAARALGRVSGRSPADPVVRRGAAGVAWALRGLFNLPEVTELVRNLGAGRVYWQEVLSYGLSGNLQAVLDEFGHVLVPAQGFVDTLDDEGVARLATAMTDVIHLRTVNYTVSDVSVQDGQVVVDRTPRLRAHFAVRFGQGRGDDESQVRSGEVREAFNSPFWPFVLASTSVGQEGLDFHQYAHAIVHWNLPSNPVDMEQREGRIHRFKGHAIRRNIAADHATLGRTAEGDPWEAMFDQAKAERAEGENDLIPYWLYPREGGATIDRYVPTLPMSRDRARELALSRALASYRLAFGQPRQDDLLAYLAQEIDDEALHRLTELLRIDLTPRGD